jgi:hypothetical protein
MDELSNSSFSDGQFVVKDMDSWSRIKAENKLKTKNMGINICASEK